MKSAPYYTIVIPARMASQRLPGKPLLDIGGRSLIERVWRQARASSASSVLIATDDRRVFDAARTFGADVVMTSDRHESGSDRIAECIGKMTLDDAAIIVNLQGDEPLMPPACLDQVAALLEADDGAGLASLYWPSETVDEIRDPNVVKVVIGESGQGLYFSRSVIPHPRHAGDLESALAAGARWKRHIGLYAWRAGALRAFASRHPSLLERTERLEQLRVLEAGGRIAMAQACAYIPAGVDTAEDLERVRAALVPESAPALEQ